MTILETKRSTFSGITIIQGQYTVGLDSGVGFDVTTSQTGFVPTGTQSLQFKARAASFSVSLGGQNLNLIALGIGPNYTLYGADASAYAGQTETLAVTSTGFDGGGYFDSFVFSPSPIPEPNTLALGALGGALMGLWRWRRFSS